MFGRANTSVNWSRYGVQLDLRSVAGRPCGGLMAPGEQPGRQTQSIRLYGVVHVICRSGDAGQTVGSRSRTKVDAASGCADGTDCAECPLAPRPNPACWSNSSRAQVALANQTTHGHGSRLTWASRAFGLGCAPDSVCHHIASEWPRASGWAAEKLEANDPWTTASQTKHLGPRGKAVLFANGLWCSSPPPGCMLGAVHDLLSKFPAQATRTCDNS